MQSKNGLDVKKLVGVAVFVAVVVALQILGSFIRFGAFSVSLVLVPIVVGASVYGAATGALLGGAFGIVVLINCANGVDIGGYMLWSANPPLTAALCLLKGVFAGYAAGSLYARLSKINKFFGVLSAAVICPVVNTGIFILAMICFYRETLVLWAGETHFLYYAFIGLAGVNFLLELCANIVLCPAAARIIKAVNL